MDNMQELLKNEAFKKMYFERINPTYEYYERLKKHNSGITDDTWKWLPKVPPQLFMEDVYNYIKYSECFLPSQRNSFYYGLQLICERYNIETDNIDSELELCENVLRFAPFANGVSIGDRRWLYKCSKVLSKDELSKLREHYNLPVFEFESYIRDGKEGKKRNKYFNVIDNLLRMKDSDEIVDYLEKQQINISDIRIAIQSVVFTYYTRYSQTCDELNDKINIYADYKKLHKKEKRAEEIFPFAKDVVTQYISSSEKSISDFCHTHKIDENDFKKYLDAVEIMDPDLYDQYSDKGAKNTKASYTKLVAIVNDLAFKIENGVTLDIGKKRAYDVVDYYSEIHTDPSTIKNVSKKVLDNDKYLLVARFFAKNKIGIKERPLYVKATLEGIDEIDCQRDKNGFPISGTGRLITETEKLGIIDYLRKNNVPLTDRTYGVARKRYLNNQLFDSDIKNDSQGQK